MSLLKAVSLQVLKEGGEATLVVSLPFFHFWVIQGCCVQFLGYLKFDAFFFGCYLLVSGSFISALETQKSATDWTRC